MSANESITETSVISYTIDGASEATGIPKSTLWEHIKSGRIIESWQASADSARISGDICARRF